MTWKHEVRIESFGAIDRDDLSWYRAIWKDCSWKERGKNVLIVLMLACFGIRFSIREDGVYVVGVGPIARRVVERIKADKVLDEL